MRSWTDEEPGLGDAVWQIRRVARRARRRPLWVAATALLVLGMGLGFAARRRTTHEATYVVRLTELKPRALAQGDWSNRSIRAYVTEVAFSQDRLLAIIKKHRLSHGPDGRFDPVEAVTELREAMDVDVVQNHAIALMEPEDRPRSAHVSISYVDTDRVTADSVARELADLVSATGRQQRLVEARASVKRTAAAVNAARTVLNDLRVRSAQSLFEQAKDPSQVPLGSGREEIRVQESRLDRLERERADAELALRQLEEHRDGVEVEVLPPDTPREPLPMRRKLAIVGAVVSAIALPLAIVFVGAFDRRLWIAEDIRHLGLPFVGHIDRPDSGAR